MSDTSNANTYIADAEALSELARLLRQDTFINQAMNEAYALFPEEDFDASKNILDLGCGPGGWCLEMARKFPDTRVIGIDISRRMIEYAQMLALAENLPNVQFMVMDICQNLQFPDNYFSLVNSRYMGSFLRGDQYSSLFQEIRRILKPGGQMRWTENEAIFSNSAPFEILIDALNQALKCAQLGFSPTGRSPGIAFMMQHLIKKAGFLLSRQAGLCLDFSYGEPAHEPVRENTLLEIANFTPFVASTGVLTVEAIQQYCQQVMQDFSQPTFVATFYNRTVWAVTPR